MKNRSRFLLFLLYAALLSPWIAMGAVGALNTNANSPLDWVDSNFAARRQYDDFSEHFGAGDVVVISWPGCRIDDVRLDSFVKSLRESPVFHEGDQWLFHRVTSGRETLRAICSPPLSLPIDTAIERLEGTLIGPDQRTASVVIGFNEHGLRQRARLVPLIREAAFRYCGAKYASQHLAGPIMDGYTVDQASQTAMNRFAPLSAIIVFCVCLLCLDSLAATMVVFGVSVLCQAVTLAILHYCGGTMTALMIVLPPLVQVLALAGGIHLVNYYFDAATQSEGPQAIAQAFRTGWLPCVLSGITTAIGLGSLFVSGLVAVREFGAYAAVGVIVTVAILLAFVPGIIALRPIKLPPSMRSRGQAATWKELTRLQSRWGGLVSICAVVLMVGLGFGVARLRASVRIETLLGNDSRLIRDCAWLEQHVGPLVPIDVVTSFDSQCSQSTMQRMDLLRRIEKRLASNRQVDVVTSCRDFFPPSPQPVYAPAASDTFAMGKSIATASNYLCTTSEGVEKWRITAHVSALGSTNYGNLLREMQRTLESEVFGAGDGRDQGVSLELSGLMPLVHEIQQQLLRDLFASFLTAFVLIAIVMTIVQAGLLAGLLAMLPNVFPALTLFGVLGWLGHPIDIGSIMTASVAMGIAVDDTLHFLTFFQRGLDAGQSRPDAVLGAQNHCGRAIIQTTLICGAGLSIFVFSDFVPTARFAWMMVALLSAALVGDLIVLPGLLLGPLGRVFDRHTETPSVLAWRAGPQDSPGQARKAS